MQKSVQTPTLQRCIDIFGEQEGPMVYKILTKSVFRSASFLLEQINFLKKKKEDIKVRATIKIFGISNDAYYKAIRNEKTIFSIPKSMPSRLLLKIEDENAIIEMIYQQQLNNDCMTGKDIREYASSLYKKSTGADRNFSRDWFYNFKFRHQDDIAKVKAECVDDLRAQISIEEVNKYFEAIDEMMLDPPIPYLLINFDETGFGRRPDKGKRKTFYVSKKCKIKPFWRELTDLHHVSLVMAISVACQPLKPLCFSTKKKPQIKI